MFFYIACAVPKPPPAPPPPRDFSKPDPDKLLSEMTSPYDAYKWVETVLVYQLDDVPAGKIPEPAKLAEAARRVDARLGQFKLMRRVVVHERWVAVGLGGVTQRKLDRIRGYLDCRQALSVSPVKPEEGYVERMVAGVDPATGVKAMKSGKELFFIAPGLTSLRQALSSVPNDLRLPRDLWLAFGPYALGPINTGFRTYLLQAPPWVDASDLRSVKVVEGRVENAQEIDPRVDLTFSPGSALRLARLSGKHVGVQAAVVATGRVYSVSTVQEPIKGGILSLTVSEPKGEPLVKYEQALELGRRMSAVAGLPRVSMLGLYGIEPIGR